MNPSKNAVTEQLDCCVRSKAQSYDLMKPVFEELKEALQSSYELLDAQTPRYPDDPILKITLKVMKQALAHAKELEEKK